MNGYWPDHPRNTLIFSSISVKFSLKSPQIQLNSPFQGSFTFILVLFRLHLPSFHLFLMFSGLSAPQAMLRKLRLLRIGQYTGPGLWAIGPKAQRPIGLYYGHWGLKGPKAHRVIWPEGPKGHPTKLLAIRRMGLRPIHLIAAWWVFPASLLAGRRPPAGPSKRSSVCLRLPKAGSSN